MNQSETAYPLCEEPRGEEKRESGKSRIRHNIELGRRKAVLREDSEFWELSYKRPGCNTFEPCEGLNLHCRVKPPYVRDLLTERNKARKELERPRLEGVPA